MALRASRHIWIAAILIVATDISAQSARIVPDSQLMRMPATGLDPSGAPLLRESPNVIIPTTLLYLSISGSLKASSQGTRVGSTVTIDYDVRGLDRAELEEVALLARADLSDRLRDRGFTILDANAAGASHLLARIERFPTDAGVRAPTVLDAERSVAYAIVAPTDSVAFDRRSEQSLAALRALARELNAAVLIPELWFQAPQMDGRKDYVRGAYSAQVTVSQGMDLARASLTIIAPSGAVGTIAMKQPLVQLSDIVGNITPTGGDSARFTGLGARDLRILGRLGSTAQERGTGTVLANSDVIFDVASTAYTRGILRGAASFFQAVAMAVAR
jgi:hypothetical protein